jgi:hypothetical protein
MIAFMPLDSINSEILVPERLKRTTLWPQQQDESVDKEISSRMTQVSQEQVFIGFSQAGSSNWRAVGLIMPTVQCAVFGQLLIREI